MQLGWFDDCKLGVIEGTDVLDVSAALRALPAPTYPAAPGDLLITHLDAVREAIGACRAQAPRHPVASVHWRRAVAQPGKVIGVPVNYLDHVEEVDAHRDTFANTYVGPIENQGLFIKASSCLVGASDGVTLRFPTRRTDHELELGVVIGKVADRVSEAQALDHVAGYAVALDMVFRGPEDRSFRKSADSYGVLGPWLTTADAVTDPQALDMVLRVNGEVRQRTNTRLMIMKLARQIAWASSLYTLWPGDVIMTGTCAGVSQVHAGDVMSCEIEQVGRMEVRVMNP